MDAVLMGIDIGTSACKVALFSPDGKVLAEASRPYPVLHPREGWAEQAPADWWGAVCQASQDVLARFEGAASSIAGVGVDGQSWSAIPLSAAGEVLCNTPIWMDTRAADICRELAQSVGEEAIFEVCGNPLQPSYTLPKVLWYKRHRPEVYRRAGKILQSNGYIVWRLTGEVSQDLSQGYGWQCFNTAKGQWDEAMCHEMGLRRSLLPELVPCHAVVGRVTGEAATQSGIPAGTPVVAGGLDAACGTLGAGVLHSGQTQEQGGQAGGMSLCLETYRADPRLIAGWHVVPGRWLLQGGTVGGGGIMRWVERELGADERQKAAETGRSVFALLDEAAAAVPPGSEGVVFLPYMAGERSPLWNPHAKGVYYGLDYAKTRAHLVRASLEGAAFALRHNLEVALEAGAGAGVLRAMGGAANSRLWTQIKSDVTGHPIEVPSSDTATTLGAALLAGVAVGVWPGFEEAVESTVRVTRRHEPDPAHTAAYADAYATYRALYRQLAPLMTKGNEP